MPKYMVKVVKVIRMSCEVVVEVPSMGTDDEARWLEMERAEELASELTLNKPEEEWDGACIERYQEAEPI